MEEGPEIRTLDDLERAVRAIARHFRCDVAVIVGSQAVLVGWPDAPVVMRTSPEIDAYPDNARAWEAARALEGQDIEASEEIFAHFGPGSHFHRTHGFYIDGCDDGTAALPPGWRGRAVSREILLDGSTVRAVAPSLSDLIVSKLIALRDKDKAFIRECHRTRHLDRAQLRRLLAGMVLDAGRRAMIDHFLDTL